MFPPRDGLIQTGAIPDSSKLIRLLAATEKGGPGSANDFHALSQIKKYTWLKIEKNLVIYT